MALPSCNPAHGAFCLGGGKRITPGLCLAVGAHQQVESRTTGVWTKRRAPP